MQSLSFCGVFDVLFQYCYNKLFVKNDDKFSLFRTFQCVLMLLLSIISLKITKFDVEQFVLIFVISNRNSHLHHRQQHHHRHHNIVYKSL